MKKIAIIGVIIFILFVMYMIESPTTYPRNTGKSYGYNYLFGESVASPSSFTKSARSTPAPIVTWDNEPDIMDA